MPHPVSPDEGLYIFEDYLSKSSAFSLFVLSSDMGLPSPNSF